MAPTKQWADGPFDLISSIRVPQTDGKTKDVHMMVGEMIQVHNMFIRAMNSIYLQCINVEREGKADLVADFVNYAHTWGVSLEEHHDTEETMIFPAIDGICGVPGLMDGNVDQHKAFHGGLETYMTYLAACRDGADTYSGEKLKAIIDSFMPVLTTHLHDEIATLIGLEKYEDKTDWKKWFDEIVGRIVKKGQATPGNTTTFFPFVLHHNDKTFGRDRLPKWPPIPWLLELYAKWFWVPKHKTWWQFAPCTDSGMPRDMPFV